MIRKFDAAIDKFCFYLLVICLICMLTLAVLSIFLRWFQVSFMWMDPLIRHLVFLSAFLGGSLATGKENHIRIDIAGKIFDHFGPRYRNVLERVLSLVTAVTCFYLAKAAWDFSKMEFEFANEAFLGIKSGYMVLIITFGLGLIGLRFLLRTIGKFERPAGVH